MSASTEPRRTAAYKPLFAWYCAFAVLWTICLLYAGGFTTSIQAGMAFLDWPLSNGSINPDGWLTEPDKRAEHSHRLLGAMVGLLTISLAIWLQLKEQRRWLRRLGWSAVGLVVFQGLLGGARVLFDRLNTGADHNLVAQTFAVAHACTAQVFLCVLVAIGVANTRVWIERPAGLPQSSAAPMRTAGLVACAAIFVQLVLGALMRHNHAALAISTFPLTPEGGLLPAYWDFRVGVHFAHRAWAVVVTLALLVFAARLWSARHRGRAFGGGALALAVLLAAQIALGALVIWTLRNSHAATVHMLAGAVLLATCWGLTFLSWRSGFDPPEREAPSRPSTPAGAPA